MEYVRIINMDKKYIKFVKMKIIHFTNQAEHSLFNIKYGHKDILKLTLIF